MCDTQTENKDVLLAAIALDHFPPAKKLDEGVVVMVAWHQSRPVLDQQSCLGLALTLWERQGSMKIRSTCGIILMYKETKLTVFVTLLYLSFCVI